MKITIFTTIDLKATKIYESKHKLEFCVTKKKTFIQEYIYIYLMNFDLHFWAVYPSDELLINVDKGCFKA